MSLSVILLLFLLILFILLFMYLEPIVAKHKIKNNNEYGSARFSTKDEIYKNFTKEKISNVKEVGFPIWYDKSINHVWFDKETPHYVYLGSSGSGKSVTAVIPMISFIATAKIKRSVFVTDPKGEIYHLTSKMLNDNGYQVLTIDFRHPEMSNHINILEPIITEYEKYMEYETKAKEIENKKLPYLSQNQNLKEKLKKIKLKEIDIKRINNKIKSNNNVISSLSSKKLEYENIYISSFAETNRLITSLSAMIMYEKNQGKDPFWNNSAKNLLEGLIGFFLEYYNKNSAL